MAAITESLYLALGIMAMGMFLVFIFLSMLIIGVKLVAKYYAPNAIELVSPYQGAVSVQESYLDNKKIAAITLAIHQYRNKT